MARASILILSSLYLPKNLSDVLPDGITLDDAFIGNGGFTGSVTANWEGDVTGYDDATARTILGFGFTLQSINVVFRQNALVSSAIIGFLKVPFFDDAIKLDLAITDDGDFTVAISNSDGIDAGKRKRHRYHSG